MKKFFNGTHRARAPRETIKSVLGRVRASGLPVFEKMIRLGTAAGGRAAVYAVTHDDRFSTCRLPSWGKGLTAEAARASALMERVERYTASDVRARRGELVWSDHAGLKGEGAVSRWDLVPCNLQRKMYTRREVDAQRLPWARCSSLCSGKDVLVPANLVYFHSGGSPDDFSDTTGLASGNTVEEAVLHGLCEVVERHLEEVVHRNKVKVPTIDAASIRDPRALGLLRWLRTEAGLKVKLSYLTGKFGVPAIRVFAYPKRPPYLNTFSGYHAIGVHPDRTVALCRALTELVQERATLQFRLGRGYDSIELCGAFPPPVFGFFNDIVDEGARLPFGAIPSAGRPDLRDDIDALTGTLAAAGCDVMVKDITHPALGIPVVRVLVKGLQPGILGISLNSPYHKVARISRHLDLYRNWVRKVKGAALAGDEAGCRLASGPERIAGFGGLS